MVLSRAWRRRAMLGLPTVLGLARRGFFIPHRHADAALSGGARGAVRSLVPLFRAAEPRMTTWLERLEGHADALAQIGTAPPPEPRWQQDWFPRLDGAMAYTMVRELKPARIVEVGSGHSTRFLARAVRDAGISCAITAIDPQPRADLSQLAGISLKRMTAQAAGTDVYAALCPGDILAIDSSHVLMPGTDVDLLFSEVMPTLPNGVYIHIHDIFLPDPYPRVWEWLGYNEQLGVALMLLGGAYEIQWSSHYAVRALADAVAASAAGSLPLGPGAFETSLWLKKLR